MIESNYYFVNCMLKYKYMQNKTIHYNNPLARFLTCLTDTDTIMFFGFILTEAENLDIRTLAHERTHRLQWIFTGLKSATFCIITVVVLGLLGCAGWWMLSFLAVPFLAWYLLYILEWLFRLCQYRDMQRAYEAISYEREADRVADAYVREYLRTGKEPEIIEMYLNDN